MPGMVGFGIGSGVPKLQPVLVQSGVEVLSAGAVDVGPMLQLEPVQLSENRLCAPSGVGPSGMSDAPAPMLRPPQVRFLMVALEPSFVLPQLPPPAASAKSRTVGGAVDPLSSVFTSRANASTLASSAALSLFVRQSFGVFASSFAKQPFVGSTPPLYFACTFWMQAARAAGSGLVASFP